MQACKFRIGSFSGTANDVIYLSNFTYDMLEDGVIRLDYKAEIDHLRPEDTLIMWRYNFSVAGFEIKFSRYVTKYIIQYYLTSGIFVIVSWVSHYSKSTTLTEGIKMRNPILRRIYNFH